MKKIASVEFFYFEKKMTCPEILFDKYLGNEVLEAMGVEKGRRKSGQDYCSGRHRHAKKTCEIRLGAFFLFENKMTCPEILLDAHLGNDVLYAMGAVERHQKSGQACFSAPRAIWEYFCGSPIEDSAKTWSLTSEIYGVGHATFSIVGTDTTSTTITIGNNSPVFLKCIGSRIYK